MTVLNGYGGGVQFVQNGPAMAANDVAGAPPGVNQPSVIDGTPVRVVVLALAAAAGLTALHMAGFRFSVTAST